MARTMIEQGFWKYEGTANDFIVVESDDPTLDLDPQAVAALCHRHRGIGADGVLLITPPSPGSVSDSVSASRAAARMVVRNADGSRPEMCGNGLRCVALHVALRGLGASAIDADRAPVPSHQPSFVRSFVPFVIETDAGRKGCLVELDEQQEQQVHHQLHQLHQLHQPTHSLAAVSSPTSARVTVDMGVVRVGETTTVEAFGRTLTLIHADAGNPHAITFDALEGDELGVLGARLQTSREFPHGVNLERVVLEPMEPLEMFHDQQAPVHVPSPVRVDVRVFERGVGYTLACGTGACAVAAVLVAQGIAGVGVPIAVTLPGGALTITLDAAGRASMTGPARRVYQGVVHLASPLFMRPPARSIEPSRLMTKEGP